MNNMSEEIKEFYYQIKGKLSIPESNGWGISNWGFPPIFCGKISAINKKKAKELIDEEYGKKFPQRVLQKDLDSNEFLLNIEEIKPGSHIKQLFELQTCIHCKQTFYVIDKYNDNNCSNKGFDFCSDKCKVDYRGVQEYLRNQNQELSGNNNPIIYKITNKATGQCYIGKTTQVFTLRWYQHFFQMGNCKFHDAIKNSKVCDWVFEVQEIVIIPEDIKTVGDIEKLIIERERYWIEHYNSIENGYNSKL